MWYEKNFVSLQSDKLEIMKKILVLLFAAITATVNVNAQNEEGGGVLCQRLVGIWLHGQAILMPSG